MKRFSGDHDNQVRVTNCEVKDREKGDPGHAATRKTAGNRAMKEVIITGRKRREKQTMSLEGSKVASARGNKMWTNANLVQ